jgi:hypothetical protein
MHLLTMVVLSMDLSSLIWYVVVLPKWFAMIFLVILIQQTNVILLPNLVILVPPTNVILLLSTKPFPLKKQFVATFLF